jgi:hypothetical protein
MGGIGIDHVSKVFPGDVLAVDDVDLTIAEGEFMVLVGPRAAGSRPSCGSSPAWRPCRPAPSESAIAT